MSAFCKRIFIMIFAGALVSACNVVGSHPPYRVSCAPLVSSDAFEYENGNFIFTLDQGQVGNCSTDRNPYISDLISFQFSERQEITFPIFRGRSVADFDFTVTGAPAQRATFFQIHDGRSSAAPPAWIGINQNWNIIFHDSLRRTYGRIAPNRTYQVQVVIDYEHPVVRSSYFLDGREIRTITSTARSDFQGAYEDTLSMKIGMYRVNSQGTTTFTYENFSYRQLD